MSLPNNNNLPANIHKCANIILAGFCGFADKCHFGHNLAPNKLQEKSIPDNSDIKDCKCFKQGNFK